MFEQYVTTAWNLERYRRAPLAEERQRFLAHLEQKGQGFRRLRTINARLCAIASRLDLYDRVIPEAELVDATERWVKERTRPTTRSRSIQVARTDLISLGRRWLDFMGRWEGTLAAPVAFEDRIDRFLQYLERDRGLARSTIVCRRRSLEMFFNWLDSKGSSPETASTTEITRFISTKRVPPWKRATIKFHVYTLRSFFRYAAERNCCEKGLASTIEAPRTYALEQLPYGPTWDDVKRLIASVSGNDPTSIRSRAIILLLALYGFRQGEVRGLMLEDIDWSGERIHVRRPKQSRTQTYPLAAEVGEAVLRYLQEVRPKSAYRQVFLTVKAPYHPLTPGGLGGMFARQLKRLNLELPHYGPHTLRHACATHLLERGFSLKEIGDHLGHRSSHATQIYTKVDLSSLRQVADVDLACITDPAAEAPRIAPTGMSTQRLLALRQVGQINLGVLL